MRIKPVNFTAMEFLKSVDSLTLEEVIHLFKETEQEVLSLKKQVSNLEDEINALEYE